MDYMLVISPNTVISDAGFCVYSFVDSKIKTLAIFRLKSLVMTSEYRIWLWYHDSMTSACTYTMSIIWLY